MVNRRRAQPQVNLNIRVPPEALAYLDAMVAHYRDSGKPWSRADLIVTLLSRAKAPDGLEPMRRAAFPEES